MTIWKERLLRNIPLWATFFMISVIVFIDVALLHRLEFLVAAIPILIIVTLSVAIALWRHYHQPKEATS
ncbi:MAG: hypothetical protein ACFFCO_07420 [Promethearchaeota archaeon]